MAKLDRSKIPTRKEAQKDLSPEGQKNWGSIFGNDCENVVKCHNKGEIYLGAHVEAERCDPCHDVPDSKYNKRSQKNTNGAEL